MRVVQLITQGRGGPVDHAVDVATELVRLGHESHLVGPGGTYAEALTGTGVHLHETAVTAKADLAGARRLARTLAAIDADVVHCQDRRAGLVGRVLARRGRTATVYTLHGVPDSLAHLVRGNIAAAPPSRRDRLANLRLERLLAATPRSLMVTPCEAVACYARTHIGVRPGRVTAVHNGVVPARWQPADPTPVARPGDRPVNAVWLGVMQPVKRLPALVRTAAGVANLQLLLVGDGPERGTVEATVSTVGATDRVQLAGFRDDPAPLLAAADLFVLPSAAEACPMAILQAMACGLPVVASRAGGIPEVVRDGVDGLLVPTGDDAALGRALRRLVEDHGLRRELGANARSRVQDHFTLERCTRRLLDVYAEVIA